MAHECLVVLSSCSWTKWPRMHYCNCRMLSYERLRREYCKCELFEGSTRKSQGPNVCLREVGGDCRAARGQSCHASSAATFKGNQSNRVRFAGSAQMFAQTGSLRARPIAEVATCTCLHICTMAPAACCAVSAQHTVQAKWWWDLPA